MRLFLVAAVLAIGGCESPRYTIRDVPFCAGDDPIADYGFARTYIMMTHADERHYSQQTLYSMGSGPSPGELGVFNKRRMLMVVVACPESVKQLDGPRAKDLSEDVVPSVCVGQEVVFSGWLEAQPSPEASALGYDGFFHFPVLELACRGGVLTQANDRTLAQHIYRFREAVDAYHARHGALPESMEVLTRETLLAPMPVDPWGTALRFTAGGTTVFLHAAGPDKAFDSADDIEVLRQTSSSSSSIITFPGIDHGAAADYRELLVRRGIAAEP